MPEADQWRYASEVNRLRKICALPPVRLEGEAARAEAYRLRDALVDGKLKIRVHAALPERPQRQPFRTEGLVRRERRERTYRPEFLAKWGLES